MFSHGSVTRSIRANHIARITPLWSCRNLQYNVYFRILSCPIQDMGRISTRWIISTKQSIGCLVFYDLNVTPERHPRTFFIYTIGQSTLVMEQSQCFSYRAAVLDYYLRWVSENLEFSNQFGQLFYFQFPRFKILFLHYAKHFDSFIPNVSYVPILMVFSTLQPPSNIQHKSLSTLWIHQPTKIH